MITAASCNVQHRNQTGADALIKNAQDLGTSVILFQEVKSWDSGAVGSNEFLSSSASDTGICIPRSLGQFRQKQLGSKRVLFVSSVLLPGEIIPNNTLIIQSRCL